MERNLERKTLSFGKGMTNVPGDLLSEDGDLEFSENFICKDGEMKAIQKMKNIGIIGGKIMYAHKMADYENIITYDKSNNNGTICWYDRKNFSEAKQTFGNIGNVADIKSVGNTLLIATDKGIRYLVYNGGSYKDLGVDMPEPKMKFGFNVSNELLPKTIKNNIEPFIEDHERINFTINDDGTLNYEGKEQFYENLKIPESKEKYDDLQTSIKGAAAQAINIVKENKFFVYPFFVRFAWKLYDGTYTKISSPIICFPTARRSGNFYVIATYIGSPQSVYIRYEPYYGKMRFVSENNAIGDWSDIIKELVVFATEGVPQFNIDDDWTFKDTKNIGDEFRYDGIISFSDGKIVSGFQKVGYYYKYSYKSGFDRFFHIFPHTFIVPKRYKSDDEITEELVNKTQFFKLFSLKIGSSYLDGNVHDAEKVIKDHIVENLTSQEQLKDDYFGWTNIVASTIYTYNNRINLLGVKRFPFRGFNSFTAAICNNLDNFVFYTHIKSGAMDTWVKSDEGTAIEGSIPGWLFYPDPNAKEMIIRRTTSDTAGIRVKLTPHPMLNGAYSIGLPTSEEIEGNIGAPEVTNDSYESLDSQIFTSLANNPFVFEASGDNTVGTGKILGIAANTEAVSQGQFGQYPLLVFTDEGIYAMSVNSEGLYSSIHPISREVCNNAESITPTDKLIFFTSEKGLMATSGGEAVCVSGNLRGGKNVYGNGDSFRKFLKDCLIAYDYKASQLRIFSKNNNYQYVYNIADKNFGVAKNYIEDNHVESQASCTSVINNYPDNLIQMSNGYIFSLSNIPLEEDDKNDYNGIIMTRPLKLGGSSVLKSLRGMKHLFDSETGTIKVELYGSNNCKDWLRLTSVGGKPWKYFKLEYTLKNFKASDTFEGSIIEVQPRREDKIR